MPRRFLRLLSLGTTFIAADNSQLQQQVEESLAKYKTSLAWYQVFGWPSQSATSYPRYRPRTSDRPAPPQLEPIVADYISELQTGLLNQVALLPSRPSYFVKEIRAFRLWANDRLVVKPADKNLGLTIMTKEFYETMCMEYLNKSTTVVDRDPDRVLNDVKYLVELAIIGAGSAIDNDVRDYLLQAERNAKALPDFYCIPKLHKGNKGRPIVAFHSGPMSHLSAWLGNLIHPLTTRLKAYLRDSSALIDRLVNTSFPQDCWIVTFDVTSMYPNMRLDRTLTALDYVIDKVLGRDQPRPAWYKLARAAISLLFNECYMRFRGRLYKQSEGIAMGTDAAPNLANLYLADIEEELVVVHHDVLLYNRYIDDGLAIVRSRDTAEWLVLCLSTQSGLNLEVNMSQLSGVFLDLELRKGNLFKTTGLLEFKTYRKALNRFLYVPAFSAHHPSNIRSWIYAELLRIRNTSLLDDDFYASALFFLKQLRRRGYSLNCINDAVDRLPNPLLSPLVRKRKAYVPPPLPRPDGQVMATPAPPVFRAPYNLGNKLKYGQLVNQGLAPVVHVLNQGAGQANPDPVPPSKLVIANTHQRNMSKMLVRARFN